MDEPSIYIDDLSNEELVILSEGFGIPIDEVPLTARRTFRRSPAGVALEAHVRSYPKKYVGVEEIGAPARSVNVDCTSRWFMRKSIDETGIADEDAERLMPGS